MRDRSSRGLAADGGCAGVAFAPRPTSRLVALALLGLVPFVLATTFEPFAEVAVSFDILLLAAFVVDVLGLPSCREVRVERRAPERLTLGAPAVVSVSVRCGRSRRAVLIDEPPQALVPPDVVEIPRALRLVEGGEARFEYSVRPRRRGRFDFGPVNVHVDGPLGLARRRLALWPEGSRAVRAYPSLGSVEQAGLDPHLLMADLGIKRVRRPAEGTELESLRDAVPEDELRRIDWRATGRRGKLTARSFVLEENHDLLLAIDTGRLMGTLVMPAQADGHSVAETKLDRAISAALRLAAVALRAGDRVGLISFGQSAGVFVRPEKGRAQLGRLLEATLDLVAQPADPSFVRALGEVRLRQKKRAMLVFLTDFVDREASQEMVEVLGLLAARHAVLFVALRDPHIRAVADTPINDLPTVYRGLAAMSLEEARAEVIEGLSGLGIKALDLPPEAVTQGAIQGYLALRGRQAV